MTESRGIYRKRRTMAEMVCICGAPLARTPGGRIRETCGAQGCIRARHPNLGKRGAEAHYWKSDDEVGYWGVHSRLRRYRGEPDRCVRADGTCRGSFEWALNHDSPNKRRDAKGEFSPVLSDYLPMCLHHHAIYDGKGANQYGPLAR